MSLPLFKSPRYIPVLLLICLLAISTASTQRVTVADSNLASFSLRIQSNKIVLNASPDLCSKIPFSVPGLPSSCPFSLEIDENYNQGLSGSVVSSVSLLEAGDQLSLNVQSVPSIPIASMNIQASVGTNPLPILTYDINYSTNGVSSALNVNLPVKQIISDLSELIPSASKLANYVSSLNLHLTSTDLLSSNFDGGDFSGGQSISWTSTQQTVSVDFSGKDSSPVLGMALHSDQTWQVALTAVVEGVSIPVTSYPLTVSFSSPSHNLFQWQEITGISLYSTVDGSGWYLSGTSAKLTIGSATFDLSQGSREQFVGWQGSEGNIYSGSDPSITFSADYPTTLAAQWVRQYQLEISSQHGSVSGGASATWYNNNTQLTLTATPNSGYLFKDWMQNGQVLSTSPNLTYSVLSPAPIQVNYLSNSGESGSPWWIAVACVGGIAAVAAVVFVMRKYSILGGIQD